MMQKFNIDFEFMLQGDIKDLNQTYYNLYFDIPFVKESRPAIISCALKHILIYEKIIADGVKNALILEDDVFLSENFEQVFNQSIQEAYQLENVENVLINYENSTLQFAAHQDKNGKVLFPSKKSRCAAAYFVTSELCVNMLDYIKTHKCNLPIDWYHNELASKINLQHYWCHPTIVEQGSHNGKVKSLIDDKKTGWLRQLSWKMQKLYKQKIRPLFKFSKN
jgi:glycosyl transferase family 25